MKLASSIWNVRVVGGDNPLNYYGYKTKKDAIWFVNVWNKNHDLKVEAVRYNKETRKWEKID